ncbi:MAG: hypothetical protein M1822_002414 [Bathelium mastoideum]|nr:MAG: hypothetical protein M1822_002414 [Bathelium mastoideum]
MLAIQTQQVDRGAAYTWANHLKFLTQDGGAQSSNSTAFELQDSTNDHDDELEVSELSTSEMDESGFTCACANRDAPLFKKDNRQLRLTEASELPRCVHYVALSYCWQSAEKASGLGPSNTYSVNTVSGTRHNNVNSEILDRAIAFARPRKVAYIWIDQECIQQDDENDQRDGIQAMDLVYQQAEYCLGLLDVCITKQGQVDVLNTMFDGEDISAFQLEALADVLELILSDRWFTRAWILQESLTGAAQMTLQLKCDPSLEKGPYLAPIYSISSKYLEIELTQLHACFSIWLPNTVEDMTANSNSSSLAASRLTQVMEKWFGMLPPQVPLDYQYDRRLACSAAAAVSYLNRRRNTVIADRIAIMANLCGYNKRLDAMQLDRLGYNFSLCAFVLSIMNGDISILQGYVHPLKNLSGRTDFLDSQEFDHENKSPGFTWSLPEWATLNSLKYLETEMTDARTQLHPSLLTESGWLLDGWLWDFDQAIDLRPVRKRLARAWDLSEFERLSTLALSVRPFLVDMLTHLLCYLTQLGYTGMADLFWDLMRLRPTEKQLRDIPEAGPFSEAPFGQIIDLDTGKIIWPNPIKTHSRIPRPDRDPFQSLCECPTRDVWRLFESVIHDGFLWAGSLCGSKSYPKSAYQAWLDRASVGKMLFTPAEYCGEHIEPRRFLRWQPRAFEVSKMHKQSPEGCEVFACHGLDIAVWLHQPARLERVCLA